MEKLPDTLGTFKPKNQAAENARATLLAASNLKASYQDKMQRHTVDLAEDFFKWLESKTQ